MDTFQLVLTTFISSGVATAIVSYLFKLKLEGELDKQRSSLQRATKVHERRIEVLCALYGSLIELNDHLKNVSAWLYSRGHEGTEYVYSEVRDLIAKHQYEFRKTRLLVPKDIAEKTDDAFVKIEIVNDLMNEDYSEEAYSPESTKNEKDATAEVFRTIPELLGSIDVACRRIILTED